MLENDPLCAVSLSNKLGGEQSNLLLHFLAIELAAAFPQNFEKVVSLCSVVPIPFFKVFPTA